MDTGDPGHTAWFQSRVQVLVRSLRSHPQWRDRLRDVDPSTSSPPPQRRPLQLGRSLASRWQQYSPAPLRRLKRLFSTSTERDPNEQDDGWESDNEDLRRQQLRLSAANVGGSGSLSDTSPSLQRRESPIESTSTAGDVRETHEESLTNLLQKTWREELNFSEHSQEVQITDSSNIPEELHNKQASHSEPSSLSQELPFPIDVPAAVAATIPENSFEDSVTTSKSSDLNTDFSVLTTSARDEDREGRYSESSQNEMTQWRRSEDDTQTVKGPTTPVNAHSTVATNVEIEGLSEADKSDSLTSLINGKLDEEVAVLLSSESIEENSSVIEVRVSEKGASVDVSSVNVEMAQNVIDECFNKVEENVGDREGMAVIGVVIKSEMDTCAVDETDQASMPPPSIVLDLPQTIDHLPSEVTSATTGVTATSTTSSQGPNRPPKLQLDISTTACPQPAARKSPVTVQEWVDSLPLPIQHRSEEEGGEEPSLEESDDHLGLGLGAEAGLLYDVLPAVNVVSPAEPTPAPGSIGKISTATAARLAREPSVQSDVTSHTGSHCSSVESYLESRRPDPEEVLLSLGFGGSAGGSVDTEVSRIPRRFLQPSKVKGVAIDDFLRYQQDLIETFESGFCGYRGLTGPSHTVPSVIVAKIMEKLRGRERENIPPSSVASAPAIGITTPSTPVISAAGKFSKAARRVLTRTAVLGALPLARQQQQQSVLTPDNRRFLDNQGSKSPEVPRKRMIIGHRSYTFGCDGDLIELEPIKDPITPITQPLIFPPKPKPLVHKDSVLSTATSLSLTSVDSDSDTDDHSSSFGLQQRRNLSTSPPKPLQFSTPNLSEDSEVSHLQRIYVPFSPVSKRMSSTSLSSWESEAISPINSLPDMRSGMRHLSTDEPLSEQEEHEDAGLKMISKRSNRFHSTPDSPLLTSWPMRYESIDEDVEMRSDQSPSLLSTSTSELSHDTQSKSSDGQVPYYGKSIEQHTELTESGLAESEELPTESNSTRELNGDEYELQNEEIEQSSETKSDKSHEQQVQIQKHVISLLQLRRSSLKRQQRVLDDEEPVTEAEPDAEHGNSPQVEESKAEVDEEAPYDSDVFMDTTPVSETVDLGVLGEHDVKNENIELEESKHLDTQEQNYVLPSETTNFADITIEQTKIKLTNCEEESVEPQNTKTIPGLLHVTNAETKGDSFEMEEINTNAEDEAGIARLSRARSDSSGFLDGDSELYSMRMLTNGNGSDMQIESSQQDVSNGDMINVDSLISENVNSDIMLGSTLNENDLSSTSLVLDSEVTFSAINDRSLPNNLLQELSSVKDWMQSNSYTEFTDRSVSDEEACAIAEEKGKEVDNNLLLELSESKPLVKQNYNTSVNSLKKASVESAISPQVRSSLSLYQESSSGRTLPGYPMSVQHLTVSVDNKELVRQRTMSLRGIEDTSSVSMEKVRRVKSAPNCLEHLTSRDDLVRGSSWSSYSNMFSFCSDESVIHVGLQRANTSRESDKRLSDINDGTLKPEASMEVDGVVSDQEQKATSNSDPPTSTRYLKPNAFPYGRGAKRSASDPSAVSGRSVKDLRELVGELADRGWEITMGTDSPSFACHSEQQLLRLQGDAVRAGLAAYGRQLVGGQTDAQNGGHEVAEACKEMQAVREVRDRIAAELRRVADLLEEQPPHRVADITGQMAVLLREQTRLCRQLETLSCDSSPSIFVEPAPCCSVLEAVREENRRLQSLVERNSLELAEIRKLLKELVAVKKS